MSLTPISDGEGKGEEDFPLSKRAPVDAHQPWTVGDWQMADIIDPISHAVFYACFPVKEENSKEKALHSRVWMLTCSSVCRKGQDPSCK